MNTYRLPIRRSARYYSLGEAGEQTRAVWIALHGYGQLAADFLAALHPLDNGRNLVVAPEALSRFYVDDVHQKVGASWMTREDREAEIEDQRNYLDALYRVATHAAPSDVLVNVLGFSQGATAACRWAASTSYRIDNLVSWAGEFPAELESSNAFSRFNSYFVHGDRDPFLSDSHLERVAMLKRIPGWHVNTLSFAGKHSLHRDTLLQLDRILAKAPAGSQDERSI